MIAMNSEISGRKQVQIVKEISKTGKYGIYLETLAVRVGLDSTVLRSFLESHSDYFIATPNGHKFALNTTNYKKGFERGILREIYFKHLFGDTWFSFCTIGVLMVLLVVQIHTSV